MASASRTDLLVCPETRQRLRLCSIEEADAALGGRAPFAPRTGRGPKPVGRTPTVLLREDGACAYPVVAGIPVLLIPEHLLPAAIPNTVDLTSARYSEAYSEMEFYNAAATELASSAGSESLPPYLAMLRETDASRFGTFPEPRDLWIDVVYDAASQWDVYKHLAPLDGKRVLQLGGKGTHAVKFLLAGAAESWLLSPMLEETACALAFARRFGVEDRLHCAAAIAEETPFADGSFDAIYSGGCVHHTVTEIAFSECARILRPGGRLGAVEPWRAPFYRVGTKIFGKREVEVHCRPLTQKRLEPFFLALESSALIHHGAISRYALLALSKLGIDLGLSTAWTINRLDDTLTSLVPGLRSLGSSVALLGTKGTNEGRGGA
jgi:SAM-dependent methyltransferase/uncharacterized protein YbaR (Trm112 family)